MRGVFEVVVDRRRSLISTAAAAVAGCHPVTILRAIDRGELEAIRLGRRALAVRLNEHVT